MLSCYANVVYCTEREEHEKLMQLPEATEGQFDPTRAGWRGFVRFTSPTAAQSARRDDEQAEALRPKGRVIR